jgi:hypothetical protein
MDVEGETIEFGKSEGREFQESANRGFSHKEGKRNPSLDSSLAVIVCSRQCEMRVEVGDN